MSKADEIKETVENYCKEVERLISLAEENRNYGRYKRYGGKIKFDKYLSRLYGMKEVCDFMKELRLDRRRR